MRITALGAALILSTSLATAVHAGEDTRRAVARLLLAHHGVPDEAVFERLGPRAKTEVFRMAADDDLSPIYRDRALLAAAHWPHEALRDLYREVLADPKTTPRTRQRVLQALAVGFGEDAVGELSGYLDHPDADARLSAAFALRRIDHPRARLELRRGVLSHPELERALRAPLTSAPAPGSSPDR